MSWRILHWFWQWVVYRLCHWIPKSCAKFINMLHWNQSYDVVMGFIWDGSHLAVWVLRHVYNFTLKCPIKAFINIHQLPYCWLTYFAPIMVLHVNSLWPSDDIWWHRTGSGSALAPEMACCMRPQAIIKDHFVYAPSQWKGMLLCNIVSHWLDAYKKWSMDRQALWCILKVFWRKLTRL